MVVDNKERADRRGLTGTLNNDLRFKSSEWTSLSEDLAREGTVCHECQKETFLKAEEKKNLNKPRNINPALRVTLEWFGGATGGSETIDIMEKSLTMILGRSNRGTISWITVIWAVIIFKSPDDEK